MALAYKHNKISEVFSFLWKGFLVFIAYLLILNLDFIAGPAVYAAVPCLSGTAVGLPSGQTLRVRSAPSGSGTTIDKIGIGTRFKVTGFELNGGSITPDDIDKVDRSKGTTTWLKIAYLNSSGAMVEGWVNYLYVDCSGEKYIFPSKDTIIIDPIDPGGGRDPISPSGCSDDLSQGINNPLPSGSQGKKFGNPVPVTYMFCGFHTGVDISAGEGANIVAAADGTVVHIGNMWYNSNTDPKSGRGPKAIIIEHAPGVYTTYSHNSSVANGVKVGTCVKRGQVIAGVGNLGYSDGAHLHFEVIDGVNYTGDWENPFPAPNRKPSDPICKAYKNPRSYY